MICVIINADFTYDCKSLLIKKYLNIYYAKKGIGACYEKVIT